MASKEGPSPDYYQGKKAQPPPGHPPHPPPPAAAAFGMYGGPPPMYQPAGSSSPQNDDRKLVPPGPGSSGQREHAGVYHDSWAAAVFILHLIAIQAAAIYLGITGVIKTENQVTSTSATSYAITDWAPQLGAAIVIGLVFAWTFLQLVKLAPIGMIHVSLWWGVFASAALGGFLLATDESSRFTGIVFLLLAVLNAFYAIAVRSRIPFAGAMVSQAVGVIRLFPSTVWVSYLALFLSLEVLTVWSFGVSGTLSQKYSTAIIIVFLFSLYWSMEVIRNTSHVTTAGTVATYYFQRQNMPPNPTGRALGRAVTTSFGSICFGSLLVALIHTVRTIVASIARQDVDNPVAAILASCAECVLACIEGLLRYFNKWAYVQVAMYGKSFTEAARDTWDLFNAQGFHLVINDDIIMGVLALGCVVGGLVAALVTGVWTYYFRADQELAVAIALISFCIAYLMAYLTTSVIESAVATYYVCYAEDPATLQRNDPAFYETIRARHTLLMS